MECCHLGLSLGVYLDRVRARDRARVGVRVGLRFGVGFGLGSALGLDLVLALSRSQLASLYLPVSPLYLHYISLISALSLPKSHVGAAVDQMVQAA